MYNDDQNILSILNYEIQCQKRGFYACTILKKVLAKNGGTHLNTRESTRDLTGLLDKDLLSHV